MNNYFNSLNNNYYFLIWKTIIKKLISILLVFSIVCCLVNIDFISVTEGDLHGEKHWTPPPNNIGKSATSIAVIIWRNIFIVVSY